ncbi:RAM signaling network component [Linnemannia zychae]|nr:RAM signaling network component [Linnemannia zychae]
MSQGEDGGTGGMTAAPGGGSGGGRRGGGNVTPSGAVAAVGTSRSGANSNSNHNNISNGNLTVAAATTTTPTTATNVNIGNGRRSRGGSASTHHGNANGHHDNGSNGGLMNLIRERQRAAGSTQILDLSYANLDTFPSEIEFLRDVLEKLTMSHNSIRTLPLQLNMFSSLRYLNIRANSIKIFPAVLCHLSSLEILDMSRNKISRFPDSFGNLMNLRVLSISKNRLETIPTYIGEMNQLQFLKIEQNPIVFPPPEIVDFPGDNMEGWLNSLKSFLVAHKKEHEIQSNRIRNDEQATTHQELTPLVQQRAIRSASADSLMTPQTHQNRSEPGLRLNIPATVERPGSHPGTLSPEPTTHKLGRNNSQHGNHGNHSDDHYRFISHSRGISGDSTSSFGSSASNDCDKYSDAYFQRLATHPPPLHPLPSERIRLVEAARGILFALSQIYRAVKQVVGCSTEEKFSLVFSRLLQSANSAMTQLIQALDRFDNTAQVQVPDQSTCSEIMRCCESNVEAFRKLVHTVQTQIRNISMVADARLVRNLILLLHGALSEIRMAWDSLLPLLQGSGEVNVEVIESNHSMLKDQLHSHPPLQQQQQIHQVMGFSGINYQQQSSQHHLQLQHHSQLQNQLSSGNIIMSHQPHPFQLSPTMPTPSTWLPVQIPQRSQNMSRASNHSAQSANVHHEEEEDTQLLLTVEHAIEAARRLVQSLTETCMTRVENLMASPQQRVSPRARSVSASPPRSTGSGASASSSHGSVSSGKPSTLEQQDGSALNLSPPQISNEQSSFAASVNSESAKPIIQKIKPDSGNLVRTPLFSPATDAVPYSNGMCLSLPIDVSTTEITTIATPASEMTATGSAAHVTEDNGSVRRERRNGTHSKGSSKASFDPALPSIPQDDAHDINSQAQAPATTTPSYQPIMTARSASVSGLPSISQQAQYSHHSPSSIASSLPSQGYLSQGLAQPHHNTQAPGLNVSQLPASQLWREMKECLLQMTEIVKRLDLDLTMIRTDDVHNHPYHFHHSGQFPQPQYQHHPQGHTPHPHQASNLGSVQSQLNQHHGAGTGLDDANILRRRFGMGVSDFVKSVVVISTLVRQLSSTAPVSTSTSRSGSGSNISGDNNSNSRFATTTTSSSTTFLSTSPSAPKTGSIQSVGDNSNLTTPTTTGTSLYSLASPTNDVTTTPLSKTVTPQPMSGASISGSSATNPGTTTTGSPEKLANSMHYSSRFPPTVASSTQQHQIQQHNYSQTEIFSRLVMTNVSNLTKITKELTVRMPRSSFRDYLLSQQTFGSSLPSQTLTGGGSTNSGHFGMITSAGGGVPNGGAAIHGGVGSAGYGYNFGYGPASASILAMRKGSLI